MRFRRRGPRPMSPDLVKVEDSLPRDGLFTQPLVVSALSAAEPERLADERHRVTFRATIKDAEGRRCPELTVDATIVGPERTASGTGRTDLMGAVRFRMTGPPGTYRIRIDDVAAGALAWHADGATTEVVVD